MKRILILTILLMSSLAWAGSTTVVVGQGGGGAEITETWANVTNWTTLGSYGIAASGGTAVSATNWEIGRATCNTTLSSVNHYVEATVSHLTQNDGGALIIGFNGTGYYYARWNSGTCELRDYLNNHVESSTKTDYSYGDGVTYKMRLTIEISGSTATVKLYIDDVLQATMVDSSTDAIVDGTKVGVYIDENSAAANEYVDDLTAGAL